MIASESTWSKSELAVMRAVGEVVRTDRDAVLATIVDVEGNAYRRPGAKMLVTADGSGIGSITAGCLEDEVVELAQRVIDDREPTVMTYDLQDDDDDVWGLGVGCNGIIDVLVTPLDDAYRPVVDAYETGTDVASLTVLESDHDEVQAFDSGVYSPSDEQISTDDGIPGWMRERIDAPASDLIDRGRGGTISIEEDGRTIELFVDGVAAPPELVVLGTGHDVGPVVELATRNDFRVTVVGFRGADATADRFPDAANVRSTSPATLRDGDAYDFDENTYAVVMTHNFVDDRLAIDELLQTPVPYVGLMGPRERFEEMLDAYADEGRTLNDNELDRVHTPIGLDLGGGSPYQIAHSIVAELLAVHNDRTPRHLTEREGPIHRRVSPTTDE